VKRIAWVILLCLAAGIAGLGAPNAHGALSESDLRQFEKGKSTLDQVVGKLGQPGRSERNDEGLKAIGYLAAGAAPDAKTSLFQSTNADPAVAAVFVFDQTGRMISYRAHIAAGAFTSEDGAGPMPNIDTFITGQQSQASIAATVADGKPHLGIQFIPTSATDAKHQQQFAQAKFQGMIVVKVLPDSTAQKAGIRRDDYIYLLNGFLVASFDDVTKAMSAVKTGQSIRVHVLRIDQSSNLAVEQVYDLKF
jgi:hypothetical protein